MAVFFPGIQKKCYGYSPLFIPRHTIVLWGVGCLCVRLPVVPPSACLSVFSFPEDDLSNCQCIDSVEIWVGIANGQILSIFDSYLPTTCPSFHFRMITLVNINGLSPKLVCALA